MLARAKPTLGTSDAGDVVIDVPRLLVSRLLLQAMSGAGKTWALRRLLEQTYGHCQHIVLDPEGELHTLRERFEYVLAGAGGDCPADLKSASLLAQRLLQLGVSTIVDIFELGVARGAFVAAFLGSLMRAPRELWHPVIVVVDEAHLFCPEKGRGDSESTAAVIDLMTRGRKRGFCGVLATQRISKLNKDAAAEAGNKLIGRTTLDVDMKRAGEDLGMSGKEEMQGLRRLRDGEFFAYGPALSPQVVKLAIGPVSTTHLTAGAAAAPPTPPTDRIRKMLAQLADLPHEAEAEARTVAELQARVNALERELRAARAAAPEPKVQIVERPVLAAGDMKQLEQLVARAEKASASVVNAGGELHAHLHKMRHALTVAQASASSPPRPRPPAITRPPQPARRLPATDDGGEQLGGGERRILTALAQYPEGRTKQQVAILTGYSHSGGGFNNYLGSLRGRGYLEGDALQLRITDSGFAALGSFEPLPRGRALFEYWQRQLGKAEREVLKVLFEEYPESRPKEYVATKAGYVADGGGFNNAISRLRTLELIEGKAKLRCSAVLHDG